MVIAETGRTNKNLYCNNNRNFVCTSSLVSIYFIVV